MRNADVRARLRALLDPVVTAAGFDLDDVAVSSAGRRAVVRVVVDRDEGVALDDVAEISRAVSARLDEGVGDLLAGAYVLEVTSPGVDRLLTLPRHWRRARGRIVSTTAAGATLTGRVVAADEDAVVVDVDGYERAIRYGELGRGTVQVEFRRPEEAAR